MTQHLNLTYLDALKIFGVVIKLSGGGGGLLKM